MPLTFTLGQPCPGDLLAVIQNSTAHANNAASGGTLFITQI